MPKKQIHLLLATALCWFCCVQLCSQFGWAQNPSGETQRVLIAVQNATGINPQTWAEALVPAFSMQFVDAQTDTPSKSGTNNLTIGGWTSAMPVSIQNFPVEHMGAVYSEDGSFNLINYSTEAVTSGGAVSGLAGPSSAILIAPGFRYVFAANQRGGALTVIDRTAGTTVSLNLPGVNRVFVNQGGTVALAFSQNTNSVYYVRKMSSGGSYSGGPSSWPSNAVDCEPQNLPTYCLFQFAPPGSDATTYSNSYFDHPYKALSSADGGTIYILNPGPEYGGTQASVTEIPAAVVMFQDGQQSGSVPSTLTKVLIPGGASNAILVSNPSSGATELFVAGEAFAQWGNNVANCSMGGNLTQIDPSSFTVVGDPYTIADGHPTRMVDADDNTLWIGSRDGCKDGVRSHNGSGTNGCLTVFNTNNSNVALIDTWNGDVTGIAAITSLHKVYYAEGGSVYIRSTTNPSDLNSGASLAITPAGTAVDVVYMDSNTDSDNTVN
ncbi:MAG: hypothetical protein ACRD3N_17330 [Terracidiphilus sp.]